MINDKYTLTMITVYSAIMCAGVAIDTYLVTHKTDEYYNTYWQGILKGFVGGIFAGMYIYLTFKLLVE